MAATSEPASVSDIANAAIAWPRATPGRYFRLSASDPKSEIDPDPSPCIANANSARPDEYPSVSRIRQSDRTSNASSAPPYARGTAYFSQPADPSWVT